MVWITIIRISIITVYFGVGSARIAWRLIQNESLR